MVTLTYDFIKHERYKHLSLCEHGLSSALNAQRSHEYTIIILISLYHKTVYYSLIKIYILTNKWICLIYKFQGLLQASSASEFGYFLPNTAFSKFDSRFKTS